MNSIISSFFEYLEANVGTFNALIFSLIGVFIYMIVKDLYKLKQNKDIHKKDHEAHQIEHGFLNSSIEHIKDSIDKIQESIKTVNINQQEMMIKQKALETAIIRKDQGKELISKENKQTILTRIDESIYILFSKLYASSLEYMRDFVQQNKKLKMPKKDLELVRIGLIEKIKKELLELLAERQKESRRVWSKQGMPTRIIDVVNSVNREVQPLGMDYADQLINNAFKMIVVNNGYNEQDCYVHLKAERRSAQLTVFNAWKKRFELELQEID